MEMGLILLQWVYVHSYITFSEMLVTYKIRHFRSYKLNSESLIWFFVATLEKISYQYIRSGHTFVMIF